MIIAEHWIENINRVLDEYNLFKEDFWKNLNEFIDSIKDKVANGGHHLFGALFY